MTTDDDIDRAIRYSLSARARSYPARRQDPTTIADPTAAPRRARIRSRRWWALVAIPAAAALTVVIVGLQPSDKTSLNVGKTPGRTFSTPPASHGGPSLPNTGPATRRCVVVGAAIATTLAPAGCARSTPHPNASPSTPTAAGGPPAAGGSTSTTIPAPTRPPAGSPGTSVGACTGDQLNVSIPVQQGAAGTFIVSFLVTNHGPTPCAIGGYFGVSLYDPAGTLITDQDDRLTPPSYNVDQPVTLAPGAQASFQAKYIENPQRLPCQPVGSFHLLPPNTNTPMVIADHGQYCPPSGIGVSATRPGNYLPSAPPAA